MLEVVSNYSVELLIVTTLAIGCIIALNSDAVKSQTVDGITHNAAEKNAKLMNGKDDTSSTHFLVHYLPKTMQPTASKWMMKAKFALNAAKLKKSAKSMNHWMVMLGKMALGIEIKDNETEIDSYMTLRDHFEDKWPFMWEVDNVRSPDAVNVQGTECRIFSSYGYLDLLRNEEVQEAAIAAARTYASGNHGPRLLGGNTKILRELEQKFSAWLGREDALLCSAGYLACLSAGVALCRKGQVVLADDKCHASLRAGLKLCGATVVYFKHNDFEDAEKKAKQYLKKTGKEGDRSRGWVMIESVYSMDGDVGDLPAAAKLARKWGLRIICDEAHGLGVLGKTGRGLEEHFGLPLNSEIDVIVGTFSKSFSSVGGFIVTDARTVKFLDFYAPGNVFSAPLSAYHAGAVLKALEIIQSQPDLVSLVQANSKKFRRLLMAVEWPENLPEDQKFELEGEETTCVLPIIFPNDPIRMMVVADQLRHKGFQIAAVCAPACPVRRPRFRLTATTAYSEKDMTDFIAALVETCINVPSSVPDIIA